MTDAGSIDTTVPYPLLVWGALEAEASPASLIDAGDSSEVGGASESVDVETLREGFTHAVFERVRPERNEARFYYLAWQRTLFDGCAVVRVHGRKGSWQRFLPPLPFDSLEEAWPTIRAVAKRRLRRGYRLVG